MKRLFIYLLLQISFVSCTKKVDLYSQLKKKLHNHTNTVVFYAVSTDVEQDSAFVYSGDSVEYFFEKKGKERRPYWGPIDYFFEIDIYNEHIYNLSDTSKFHYNPHQPTMTTNDSLYWNNIEYSSIGGGRESYHEQVLTVTDTLLSIFEKDYTMLEKFKDYYQK